MARKRLIDAQGNPSAEALLAFLRQDELDYSAAALDFGKEALPFLKDLIASSDENLSTKAAYLVGYIEDDEADKILTDLAAMGSAPLRVAAAFGAQKRKSAVAESILQRSLDDQDPSVIKFALKSVQASKLEKNLKSKIDKISKNFVDEQIKTSAGEILKKIK
ncbi:hypothetical protein CLV31_11819 [Algoriphagus aquaeductus]|uniref:HEAT repeat protein n=1 Tax=Algoriphagus aquaeductus TaxID=475299 RepID=A0A326RLZ6_9BACT|nr:hypothetical protein [Algoriphagus aquaeductus]PZV78043.1 hypothetical protein CLV31_11819 [Algoriphagus aquaeductus]